MSDQDYENDELEQDNFDTDEVDETNEPSDNETDENEEQEKKHSNKSNFKRLSNTLKEERAEKQRLQDELEEAQRELEEWRTLNPDIVAGRVDNSKVDKLEERLFTIANPEAKEYMKVVKEKSQKHNMSLDEAWEFVSLKLPKESKSKNDFDLGGRQPKVKVDFTRIPFEETGSLTKEERKKWREANKL